MNWRVQYPEDENYSDDELGFISLAVFFHVII